MTGGQADLSMEVWELLPAGDPFKFLIASSCIVGKAEGTPKGGGEDQKEDELNLSALLPKFFETNSRTKGKREELRQPPHQGRF